MSVLFDDASAEYLKTSEGAGADLPTDWPLSISGWVNPNADILHVMFWITNNAVDRYTGVGLNGLVVRSYTRVGSITNVQTTTAVELNKWSNIGATFEDVSGGQKPWVNGVQENSALPREYPNSVARCSIGQASDNSPNQRFSGKIAEVGVWDVILSDPEMRALADGFSPPMIRPEHLVAYWPCFGKSDPKSNSMGIKTTTTLRMNWANTPLQDDDHPPMIYPYQNNILIFPVAAAGNPHYYYAQQQ